MDIHSKYMFYIIFFYCLTACYTLDKEIGDSCLLPIRGTGTCKKLADCPNAKQQNRIGLKPNICNRKKGIVICCKDSSIISPEEMQGKSAPMQNTYVEPLSASSLGNLRKCQQKCREYSAPVQTRLFAAPLAIGGGVIPTIMSNCLFESKPLIYGGSLAIHGEFPHMALLGNDTQNWLCGGSLISEQFVVTAAHCFQMRVGSINVVRLGELNIMKPELNSEPVDMQIENVFIHPEYMHSQVYNDIALIKLSKQVPLSTYIRPLCLWSKMEITQNKVTATGWGVTESGKNEINDDLLKVGLDIVEQNKCKDLYRNYTFRKLREIRTSIICAANSMGGDTCQGDSGGPLEITDPQNKCIHYLIGVTAAGRGCGSVLPGIYTRISEYIDWIEGIVWP